MTFITYFYFFEAILSIFTGFAWYFYSWIRNEITLPKIKSASWRSFL